MSETIEPDRLRGRRAGRRAAAACSARRPATRSTPRCSTRCSSTSRSPAATRRCGSWSISSSDHMGLSAGADVREELDEEGRVRRMQLFADLYDAITGFPKPTIAACHGDVVGGGAEVAVACDMRVGGANLRLRFPGAALGVPVGPARLVTLCGLARRQVPAALLAHGRRRRGAAPRARQPRRARRGRPRRRRSSSPPRSPQHPPEARRPPEADAARLGRGRGALGRGGPRAGRVAALGPRAPVPRLTVGAS